MINEIPNYSNSNTWNILNRRSNPTTCSATNTN